MKILKAGLIYFIVVFGAGFILGPIRVLLVVPHLGTRMAELIEMPIMIAVIIIAASRIVRYFSFPPNPVIGRLGMGFIALSLLLLAEFSLVLWLRGMSINEYLATRDPVSGTAYYLSLAVFAIMPLIVERRKKTNSSNA